jgi:uncharacterized protein YbjT (DUF2867 family)
VIVVPAGTSLQPIDADEVAARLVELAAAPPGGRVPDLGGSRVYSVAELARAYLRASGRRRLVLPVRLPGKAATWRWITPTEAARTRSSWPSV